MGQVKKTSLALTIIALLAAMFGTPAAAETTESASGSPYVVAAQSGGEVYNFGAAVYSGSIADTSQDDGIVGIAATPTGDGYWLVTADGTVVAFGDAAHHGDASGSVLAAPIVDMTPTGSGNGYWLVGSDGGIFTYGDAGFYGSAGAIALNQPVVGIAATPTSAGYWLVAADGGIFTYGDADFYGSMGGVKINRPITGMVAMADGTGYWLFASDGGVFTFGSAPFFGSLGDANLGTEQIVGGSPAADGRGYWLAGNLGSVFPFGAVADHGSAAAGPEEPIAAIAARPQGDGYWLASGPGNTWLGPTVPDNSGSGRRIVYSNSDQRVWLIEDDGSVVDSYLVSGKYMSPSPGTYRVFSKSRHAWAGHGGITMEYMVRFAHGRRLAIGFHSIPRYSNGQPMQTEEQLGTYRSAGCVRQRVDQAKFLYEWAPVGTTVIVLA